MLFFFYMSNIQIQMPKKTKQIEKEVKEEKKVETSQTSKKQSIENLHQSNDVFTQGFRKRIAQYVALNDQVLNLKQNLEGSNLIDEIKERKNRMALRVEEAASDILKDELKSLEEWIGEQKEKINQQIKKINKAYEQNRLSLLGTGSFNEEEVKSQLVIVQKKSDERQKLYQNYDELLKKSKSVYE